LFGQHLPVQRLGSHQLAIVMVREGLGENGVAVRHARWASSLAKCFYCLASRASSAAIGWILVLQSPMCCCRNKRRLGYQGQSARSKNHRQSGTAARATHVGTPSAPPRWAIAVSEVITRSSTFITAAVSM